MLSQNFDSSADGANADHAAASTLRALLSAVENRLDSPTADGLAMAVSRAITDGDLPDGALLPPVRTVAHELALSPTTVTKAWKLLRQTGLLVTDGRRGTRVVPTRQVAPERYGKVVDPGSTAVLDLSTGVPDVDLLPSLTAALSRLPGAAVPRSYRDDPMLAGLRKHLIGDWPYRAGDLAITDGAMDAVESVARASIRYGDYVVVEDPTFPPLLDLLDHLGAKAVGVRLDEEGMDLDELSRVMSAHSPIAAILLQPRGHNPTGISMSPQRARRLATVARLAGVLVIEDDSTGAISGEQEVSLGRWIPEQTVHIRGFAKSHGPDLRIAALSGPTSLMGLLAMRRQLGQGWTSRLLQHVLLDLLTDPAAMATVVRARRLYRERRTKVQRALAAHGVHTLGADGLNLWVPVHDEAAARVSLASRGIAVAPGTPFRVAPGPPAIRVTTGLVAAGHTELATALAAAAALGPWVARQ